MNGGAVMPPKLLTGQDAKDVAAYVAAVAGK
jgi:mono/diheme cytochrome c family protein